MHGDSLVKINFKVYLPLCLFEIQRSIIHEGQYLSLELLLAMKCEIIYFNALI